MRHARKQRISFVIIADHEELPREEIILQALTKGKQMRVSLAQALAVLKYPELFQELT
nr:His/Gly/Thr/Pro-type tRNA ligase C-terminal domain-containing protein [Holospora curviuscula]